MERTKETDRQGLIVKEMVERDNRRYRRRRAIKSKLGSIFRMIFYPPLAVAFHAIAFVSRGVGFISSFGLLIVAYNVYKMIVALINGATFAELEDVRSTGALLVFPFIAYAVATLTDWLYDYFETNAY